MKHSISERTMAFAGIFQAATLVQQIARNGQLDAESFEHTITSIMRLDADSTEDVFGGVNGVQLGLQSLVNHLGNKRNVNDMEVARYIVALLHLERCLAKSPDALQRIAQGIRVAQGQVDLFGLTHSNVIANLANLYLENISPLGPRIIVAGEQGYLQAPDNANKVRAALLGGIRAAVLWRQLGGTRWQLLFNRSAVLASAQSLLKGKVD